jgi:hypothetical protein
LWRRVHEALKLEDLEELTVAIDAMKPQIAALPETDYEEVKRLVVARKAELKKAIEPKEEPKAESKQEIIEPPKEPKPVRKEEDQEIDYTKIIPVPYKDGVPRWGTFTKTMLAFIRAAKDKGINQQVLSDFYDNHVGELDNMSKDHPDYSAMVTKEYYDMYGSLGGAEK